MLSVKGIIDKVCQPQTGGDRGHRPMAAATGAVEITLPVAIMAVAYIIGQELVDT